MRTLLLVMTTGVLAACGAGGSEAGAPDVDARSPVGSDAVAMVDPGGTSDGAAVDFAGGPNFGLPCVGHEDCPGGWCVDPGDGRLCTAVCVDACPVEWACAAVSLFGGGDLTSVCLPRGAAPSPDADADAVGSGDATDDAGPACGVCGDGRCEPDCGEDFERCPGDCDVRCGNGRCQPPGGESVATCPQDCAVCGDGVCSPGEGPNECPTDCCSSAPGQAGCGDGFCIGYACGENPDTCPADCGSACGNGTCDRGENPEVCATDCKRFACGNRICEPTDGGPVGCPVDCAAACGNCICEGGESFLECPIDCGFCGDGTCSACAHLAETTACAVDCDDAPAAELCNGADDDGDGSTDEGFEDLGTPCDSDDADRCENGLWTCRADGSALECLATSESPRNVPELCNDFDDDCDGLTDEDFPDLGDSCDTGGSCSAGIWRCGQDNAGTECIPTPIDEICDGVDNDCDGDVDEGGCVDGDPCTQDLCLGERGCWHPPSTTCLPDYGPGGLLALPASIHLESTGPSCRSDRVALTLWNRADHSVTLNRVSRLGCGDDLTVEDLPATPAALDAGEALTVHLRWRPSDASPAACVIRFQSDHSQSPEIAVPITFRNLGGIRTTETFTFPSRPESDVILVIDTSGSMEAAHARLSESVALLLEDPEPSLLWRVAVIDMDLDAGVSGFHGAPRWAQPGEAGATGRLTNLVRNLGTRGSGVEQGLEAALRALTPPQNELWVDEGGDPRACGPEVNCEPDHGCWTTPESGDGAQGYCGARNMGMPRSNARLHLVFLSDEEDQSPQDVDFYAAAFAQLKAGRRDLLAVHALVGPAGGCDTGNINAVEGARYRALVDRLGGTTADICGADYLPFVEAIREQALGLSQRIQLGPAASGFAMSVTRNGSVCETGFEFDAVRRVIVLFPDGPCAAAPGDTYEIAYNPVCF